MVNNTHPQIPVDKPIHADSTKRGHRLSSLEKTTRAISLSKLMIKKNQTTNKKPSQNRGNPLMYSFVHQVFPSAFMNFTQTTTSSQYVLCILEKTQHQNSTYKSLKIRKHSKFLHEMPYKSSGKTRSKPNRDPTTACICFVESLRCC